MSTHPCPPSILKALVLTLALCIPCLNATAKNKPDEPGKKHKGVPEIDASKLDGKSQGRLKRAHHLAEKGANTEFLNSPEGIAFKDRITAVEQEINATYEKYLNIFHEDPATEKGKKMREERERLLRILFQKRAQFESEYEKLKTTSPTYHAMLEKHLKGEIGQLKGKLKLQSSAGEEDVEEEDAR